MKVGTDNITANGASPPLMTCAGQDDKIASDVIGEEAAKPKEANDVHTAGDHAQHKG
jgi:hypothetical protein